MKEYTLYKKNPSIKKGTSLEGLKLCKITPIDSYKRSSVRPTKKHESKQETKFQLDPYPPL